MKHGEVVVIRVYYNFTKFHQNRMKIKKNLIIDHLMEVSSIKVLLRSCEVVGEFGPIIISLTYADMSLTLFPSSLKLEIFFLMANPKLFLSSRDMW